jgi:transcriptional regulator with XRE-family HTH domain
MKRQARKSDIRPLYAELKAYRPDLTQIQMAEESGLSLSAVQRIASGEGVSRKFAGFFADYVAKYRPSPWAASPLMGGLRAQYGWFEAQSSQVFKAWLDSTEPLLENSRSLSEKNSIEAVFALWLLAWVAHDRAFRFADQKDENTARALSRYEQAVSRLEKITSTSAEGADRFGHLLPLLRLAHFATFFMGQPKDRRAADARVIGWIKDGKVMDAAKAAGERAPHEWSVHRNGLVMASILNDEPACRCFFERLVAADARFADLDFAPNNGATPSLRKDPDLAFFAALLQDDDATNSGTSRAATLASEGARYAAR